MPDKKTQKEKDIHISFPSSFSKKDWALFLDQAFLFSWDSKRVLVGWGKSHKQSQLPERKKNKNQVFFFLSDFFLREKKAWWSFEKWAFVPLSQLKSLLKEHLLTHPTTKKETTNHKKHPKAPSIESTPSSLTSRLWTPASRKSFLKQVSYIQRFFKKGHLKKAVPLSLEKSKGAVTAFEKCSFLLSALKKQKKDHTLYAFWNKKEGLLGLTPEILFDWNQKTQTLRSMALGGTDKNPPSPLHSTPSLLKNPKEFKEHIWVSENLLQKLQKIGDVQKSKTYEWSLSPLRHLRTDFYVKLQCPQHKETDMIKDLHPTPAVGLAPQDFNWQWLQSLEKKAGFERRYFGAPIGVLFPEKDQAQRFLCLVAIRNLQWFNGETHLISGCGFLPESQWEKEWEELKWKRDSVKNFLFS